MNKLDRGLLGDATFQSSRIYAWWFQSKRFFRFYVNYVIAGAGLSFGHRGIILANLLKSTRCCYTTNNKNRPCGFKKNSFYFL